MVEIGMKAKFVPSFMESEHLQGAERRAAMVNARVASVNPLHRNFICEWVEGGVSFRECFLFSEIDKKVFVRG
jgi:hypothetical protein